MQSRQLLGDPVVVLATEFLDVPVKGLLAGEMLVEQRLGNPGGQRQVLGGGLGITLAGEQRQSRFDNRPLPVFRRHAPPFHWR